MSTDNESLNKHWTPAEEALLREQYPTKGAFALVEVIGRSYGSIQKRARALNLHMEKGMKYKTHMDAAIRKKQAEKEIMLPAPKAKGFNTRPNRDSNFTEMKKSARAEFANDKQSFNLGYGPLTRACIVPKGQWDGDTGIDSLIYDYRVEQGLIREPNEAE